MKTFLAVCCFVLSSTVFADAGEMATGSMTPCSLKGTLAQMVIVAKQVNRGTKQQIADGLVATLEKAIKTGDPEQPLVIGFTKLYEASGHQKLVEWAVRVYETYNNDVQAGTKERLRCEKEAAGEEVEPKGF